MLRVNNDNIWINLFNKIKNVFSRIFYFFFCNSTHTKLRDAIDEVQIGHIHILK